jgi:hypothetical protein
MNPESITDIPVGILAQAITTYVQRLPRHNMNKEKIVTESLLHDCVKQRKYIVGSWSDGGLSFAACPTIHQYEHTARAECQRLSNLNPNKTYVFVRLSGAEKIVTQPQSFSL